MNQGRKAIVITLTHDSLLQTRVIDPLVERGYSIKQMAAAEFTSEIDLQGSYVAFLNILADRGYTLSDRINQEGIPVVMFGLAPSADQTRDYLASRGGRPRAVDFIGDPYDLGQYGRCLDVLLQSPKSKD